MDEFAWLGEPVDVRDLFTPERAELLSHLRGLAPASWARPALPDWTVKDVAAHLLGDDVGRLAVDRDGYGGVAGPAPGEPFTAFIHRLNQEWVDACARLSPRQLVDGLEHTGRQIAELWRCSDPNGRSRDVSWAGADPAPLWLDCARDFSEYWVHRQQIRAATGLDASDDPRFLAPVLATFVRALPHTLRDAPAVDGDQVQLTVDGAAGGRWVATRTDDGWSLDESLHGQLVATVAMSADTTWRLCVRDIEPADAVARSRLDGDTRLGEAVCRMLSIIR